MSIVHFKPVIKALSELQSRGYRDTFEPAGDGLRSQLTGAHFAPEDLVIVEVYRSEGETDPQDMAVVYAMESARGEKGILVDAFGAYSDPRVGKALERVKVLEG